MRLKQTFLFKCHKTPWGGRMNDSGTRACSFPYGKKLPRKVDEPFNDQRLRMGKVMGNHPQ